MHHNPKECIPLELMENLKMHCISENNRLQKVVHEAELDELDFLDMDEGQESHSHQLMGEVPHFKPSKFPLI